MKRRVTSLNVVAKALFVAAISLFGANNATQAQPKQEALSRGVVALPMEKGNFVSWRLLETDAKDITFDVMRDGKFIREGLCGVTNIVDAEGTAASTYEVVARFGNHSDRTFPAQAWAQPYYSLPLSRPADGTSPDGRKYSYTPNDCSVGDVDGDGEYEIILKWDPSNAHDNAHNGFTGDVIIDCYKLNYGQRPANNGEKEAEGRPMWRINLGKNIRAGAHYTQFMVFDFDGDGKAELICKTAPGSVDGRGKFVTEAATDKKIKKADNSISYVNEVGRILSGPEYLTVFSGEDGHAIHTVYYNPNRAFGVGGSAEYATKQWGDNGPGNRGERFLAGVAYLGENPNLPNNGRNNHSAIMCRGYYTQSHLWAVDFDGKQLSTRWLHVSPSRNEWKVVDGKGKTVASAQNLKATAFGQGAHSLAVGDVDGDGMDEITYGSAAIDHDGTLLYSTGLGHGDAQHLGDLDPDRPGLEYFMVHEERPAGYDLRDARTGEILARAYDKNDTGRGLAADIDSLHRGYEYWCSTARLVHAINDTVIASTANWTPQNFRIYWDGDLYDELIGNGSPRVVPGGQQPGQNPQARPAQGQGPQDRRDAWGGTADRSKRQPQSYYIAKWNGNGCDHVLINGKDLSDYGNSASCNGTKATPCLQADLFGDWREEIILYDASDRAHLNIFTTNIPTQYGVVTLMHDHLYRMGVAWQNTAYNQPPHLSYYLPDRVKK